MLETSGVQPRVMVEVANLGGLPQRNNVGAYVPPEGGREIRYGLMNVSKKQNDDIKSSDVICVVPQLITQRMVGQWFGRYVALEVKRDDWNHGKKLDKHELAQLAYHDLVRAHGGLAGFVTGVDDVRRILLGVS